MNNPNNQSYNPDVLSCLANLSNDEVFTPPEIANAMLDLLPQEIFSDPNAKFLDPACKSGVFLREIAKRLIEGLKDKIPDLQERVNHIFINQLYAIAITELTSLLSRRSVYCSKDAAGKYSVAHFEKSNGNIFYTPTKHLWIGGKCLHCGASQAEYGNTAREGLESHAYQFIHNAIPGEIENMKFDVIIGNPPYQLSDAGFGISATPIYDKFITEAKRLKPHFLIMIVPARWYAGGKGLDKFRDEMLKDNRLRIIHDYPQAYECFPGVQIKGGVCYFLWDRDNSGDCTVITHKDNKVYEPMTRPLLENGCDTFIRYNEAISILHKVMDKKEKSIIEYVSSRQPFGLSTTFHGSKQGNIKLFENQGISYTELSNISKNIDMVAKYKVYIPRASSGSDTFPHPILGKAFVGEPNTVCTETYMFIGAFKDYEECENVISYINTRFLRFLVMLKKVTQDTTKQVYQFVPLQDFSKPWTDEELYKKYNLSPEEIAFIESMIRPME